MLHGYQHFSEEIFNEYAAQTMFFPEPSLSDWKKTEKSGFFYFQKKPKVLKKARISKSGFKKAKLATLAAGTAVIVCAAHFTPWSMRWSDTHLQIKTGLKRFDRFRR